MEMEMEMREGKSWGGHVLALPYPSQGHINPMLQFSKRLVSKGLKATLATTIFISKTFKPQLPAGSGGCSSSSVELDTISDGFDEGGFMEAHSVHDYLIKLESAGSRTLAQLIKKHADLGHPFDCLVYDAFLPWALDVAKQFGLVGAAFFTQTCAVNYILYRAYHGLLPLPLPVESTPVSIPGLPSLELRDMPSFIYVAGSYPAYFQLVLNQFSNVHKADWVLVNTFYKLEAEVVNEMGKVSPLITIGPTIPSKYLDNRLEDDEDYGCNLFPADPSELVIDWLNDKPPGSVIYASFGSMACLSEPQMEELAWGLTGTGTGTGRHLLWVVRDSEAAKLPERFTSTHEASGKALILKWSPQLEVLAHPAVGCFFTHCGWNSTVEALSLGVPMVGMPQWTDQTTNAKFVESVWKVGIRVRADENGIVGREEVEGCIRAVMEGESAEEMRENAKRWRTLAVEAVSQGGTSDRHIDEFVAKLKIRS